MVTAVLPRFFVDKQTSQPQGSRVIDWSNPITCGLIGAFLPESPINFVDGEQMYQDWLPPTQSVKAQSEGKVLKNGIYTYQPSSVTFPYGYKFDLTQGAALLVASQSSAQNSNIGIGRASASGTQYWGIGLHGGSFNGAYGIWGTFNFTPGSSGVSTLQKRTVIINADGSTATLYMDGGVVSSGAYTMPAYDSSVRNRCFAFGSTAAGQTSNTATIEPSLGLVWNRPLTENEVALLTANPWQVFRRPQRAYTPLFDSTPSPTSRTFFVPRKKVMTSQPQGPAAAIDWGNPITQGLASAYIPTAAQYRSFDLATNTRDLTTNADFLPPYRPGAAGFALDSTDTNYVWSIQFDPVALRGYPKTGYAAVTVFSLFESRTTNQFGVIYGGGQDGTYYGRLVVSSDATIAFIAASNNATLHPKSPLVADTLYAATGIQSFTRSYRALYVNGHLAETRTESINNLNTGFIAGSIYNVQLRRIKLYCGYVWVRELSAAEIKSLSDNPWQIFKQDGLSLRVAEDGKVYAPFMS